MGHVSYTDLRNNLASFMDEVCDSHAPLVVTRQKGRSVVMISEEEYEGIMETLHLLRSPRNAEPVMAGVAQLDAGKGVERGLVDEEGVE
ncbi:type II toxin-antitoxin system prevent-host-death family antitoxin [Azospirillum sp. TSO35-2]|uniref:type II toxin-antitoxin system Phd/YefM family antitoxin n=1 Tax=Azospirillum sp. TSO35-2 TaxID=716796 RepID=UPI000D614977|nr:type II toxin-antitoxin system prevent-host-death family antitoxin [Azospirillum sp. TSO35-2]PWC34156.1 prevent-host-death protein [Azospirillum sp. TSO35-2]